MWIKKKHTRTHTLNVLNTHKCCYFYSLLFQLAKGFTYRMNNKKNCSCCLFWLEHQGCAPGKCFNFYSLEGTLGDNLESKAKIVTFFLCFFDALGIHLLYSQTGLSLPAKKPQFILLYKKDPLTTLKSLMSLEMWYVIT